MMGVCKSWNYQIRGLSGLFTDIAFDTSQPSTVSTAARFLEIVETQSSNLRVYAQCIVWGGDQGQEAFISRLRQQSWRFVSFHAEHLSPTFIANFNLPAPRLIRLVHTAALPEGLFSSSFSNLRILDASVEGHLPWSIATLSNLVVLRLTNSHQAQHFCATSLFDFIGRSRNLEELRLLDFLLFSEGSETNTLIHTNLKSVHFIQCNLMFILQHLQFPNATALRVESYGINMAGEDLQPSESVNYFSALRGYSIPILTRNPFAVVTAEAQDLFTNNVYLKLGLQSRESHTVHFTVAFPKEDRSEAYLQSSINGILQHVRLEGRIDLSIVNHISWVRQYHASPCIDPPLLWSPQVEVLKTGHSLLWGTIPYMGGLENTVLPGTKYYLLNANMLPLPADLVVPETVAPRSLFATGSPPTIQYWDMGGKTHHDTALPVFADAGRPIDSATINVTTLLTETFLPSIV